MQNLHTALQARADFYQHIRDFFAKRNVLAVETPTLSQHTVTDPYIDSFQTVYHNNQHQQAYFLQTSPEYHMKRLLAAGSGSIYQICKSFRNEGEYGQAHNPEFSMLEWYRLDFDHHMLMQEVSALLQTLINCLPAEKISYQDLFLKYFDINPHTCSLESLQNAANQCDLDIQTSDLNKDDWLQLLLSHHIEPQLGFTAPVFIYDYPETQAALAKIRHGDINVAERFEVYINGIEIGNGFHELTDAHAQARRFAADQKQRQSAKRFVPDIDQRFLQALQKGLPACAGIAMGLDRLLMIKLDVQDLRDILAFDWSDA